MIKYMQREVKPKNKEECINGIKAFWRQVTPQVCLKYIRHLKKVIPKAIELNGNTTGYRFYELLILMFCIIDCKIMQLLQLNNPEVLALNVL